MNIGLRGVLSAALLAFGVQGLTTNVWAVGSAGYANEMVGARAMGQANAFTGEADDPSAIYFNPAGITQLSGTQLSVGMGGIVPMTNRSGDGVPDDHIKTQLDVAPNFYLTTKRAADTDHPWALGVGLNSAFGLVTDWAPTSSVRYVATDSDIELVNVNPTVAYQVRSDLSLGAGVDYVNLYNTKSDSQVNVNGSLQDGSPDGSSDLSGHGSGWGYNVGVLYKPAEKHSIGLSYRSQVHIPITGSFQLSNLSADAQAAGNFNSATYTTGATTDLTLPAMILAGYAYHPTNQWTLLADYEWMQWNVFQSQNVAINETDPSRLAFINGGSNVITTQRDWRNTSSISIGANFKQNDAWEWRGGYAFYQRTVPTETFTPDIPDSAVHVLALGLSNTWGPFITDVAFNAYIFADRNITNTVGNANGASVNGSYTTWAPALSFNVTYKFGKH